MKKTQEPIPPMNTFRLQYTNRTKADIYLSYL